MVANGRKVGILFHPYFVAVTLKEGLLQEVDRFVRFPKERIGTRDIVKDGCFLGSHRQSTLRPFEGTSVVAKPVKGACSQGDGTRIVGVELEVPLRDSQRIPKGRAGLFRAFQRAKTHAAERGGLIVIRVYLAGLRE